MPNSIITGLSRVFTILVISTGEVTRDRLRPAIHSLAADLAVDNAIFRVCSLDRTETPPFYLARSSNLREYFLPIRDNVLPLATLDHLGFLGSHVLGWVAAPTRYHRVYCAQFAGGAAGSGGVVGRCILDKPAFASPQEADSLIPWRDWLIPISHFCHKDDIQRLFESPTMVTSTSVAASFLELGGVGPRQIDCSEHDVGYHQLGLFFAGLRASDIDIDRCFTMRYRPVGDDAPTVSTAHRLHVRAFVEGREIPGTIMAGKRVAATRQEIVFTGSDGQTRFSQKGDPDGFRPYKRILSAALFDAMPSFPLLPEHHVKLVTLCDVATQKAEDLGEYSPGETPPFLHPNWEAPHL
ncbi:MAG: hypothetical protein QGG71_26380 [Pirellulaceae bacterium]|jgi:hypothetical protein|nr:hypothetical protein [Pirellulaceae bacterium]